MLAQAIADGLLTGAIIALGAIGVSFGLQIMRFANFSHAELLSWGAYTALIFVLVFGPGTPTGPLTFGWQLIAAAVVAAVATGLLAWLTDRLVFRPLRMRGAQPMAMVFASFGAALILRHLIQLFFGPGSYFYTRELQIAVEILPGVKLLPDQLFVLVLTFVVVAALWAYLTFSRTGMAMRAMAENPALAQVCGVRIDAVIRNTWLIAGGLAALAGVFAGLMPQVHPELGFSVLLALFAAAILGGTGSLVGAVIGGFVVGLAENVAVLFINPGYKPAMSFLVLLAVLFVRPQGLFGEKG